MQKSHFQPFWAFLLKKTCNKNFVKIILPIFQPLCCCNFFKENQENPNISICHIKLYKKSFWATFCPKTITGFFQRKSLQTILSLHPSAPSTWKLEKFHASIFHNTSKTSFRHNLGPFSTNIYNYSWPLLFMPK